ncbi:PVC-type heme-binding CxxCH protein [Planctomicrobium piriforme]|uniref:Putative membrane-bound dehydrogenase domain-containing protein n=1 Tax=Planctomicrobium piriforme TaxID=1576369 RepID=A0A1I3C3H2_9PLAN|nr:PVC-type heme-binding CxxCH protein [Planctomicrobium piriforme]SFH68739.1 putative membrane-bound dehydrogenase domain-containing protein [Planctomicrobium piriforme]
MLHCKTLSITLLAIVLQALVAQAEQLEIPRRHDRPPGPALEAEVAAKKMTVPEGFTVEVVAAEPDVVNPVAMFIDERGRFWITESFEYPRKSAGPGKDRVKILEDTNGDGKVDKTTVFAEGLNIPSGIAVGYGGVWVINSPDLLYMQDTDGDGKADKTEVVLTGFGRDDTHELANSLTWGPDGWLYGLNGVFNPAHVKYGPDNPNYEKEKDRVFDFTCAMFRIHPRTREFQIFAEGTSNPWGIAINDEGEFFISACVIDHLWHIVETGYYIRQGGPYPPHTWPIGSIVKHKHQKAAYCGITWFDSDAYPPEYRGVLYMGNIHGGCINADIAERDGSTYKGKPHPGFTPKKGAWDDDKYGTIAKTGDPANSKLADFLTANDAWFMPVVEKVGPDGCLYVLDWYDRYHCYQDANADPAGIERAKGRLYRVRYKDTPHTQPFDLNKKSDDELIALLGSPNVYYRDAAQRLLGERKNESSANKLSAVVNSQTTSMTTRLHALWSLAGIGPISADTLHNLLIDDSPLLKAWGIRLAGNQKQDTGDVSELVLNSKSLPLFVKAQLAVAWPKIANDASGITFLSGLAASQESALDHIVWQNILRQLNERNALKVVQVLEMQYDVKQPLSGDLASRLFRRLLELPSHDLAMRLLHRIALAGEDQIQVCRKLLTSLNEKIRDGSIHEEKRKAIQEKLARTKEKLSEAGQTLPDEFVTLQALCGDTASLSQLRQRLLSSNYSADVRNEAVQTLIAARDPSTLEAVQVVISGKDLPKPFRTALIESISRLNDPKVAEVLLTNFAAFEPDVQPKAIEVLTQRPMWSLALLKEIDAGKVDKTLVNLNQLGRMNTFKDEDLKKLIVKHYGTIRANARSDRQGIINKNRDFLRGTPGDPVLGAASFKKVCAQCHKLYGEGAEVGPDITRNGRNNWDQLLQNVLDPSAVIGPGYQARMIATEDGRVLTGLPVEDSAERVVLKLPGGKLETIPKDQIEQDKLSELSLMPEDVEKLMTPQELADLFAYLSLDKPPQDPEAKILPGAPEQKRR